MQDVLRALRTLQELDYDIYKLREELRRLPEEQRKRRAAIDQQLAKSKDSQTRWMELKTKIKEIEDQTTISRQRMRKLESEAAGSRHDVALLAAFQHEIKTIKREISTAEELGLQLVELADQQKSETDKFKAEIEAAESVHAEFSRNVERECTVAQQKLDQLSAQRAERLQATIPPESLTLYERLLGARQGQAMAELDGRICQACYMEVPTNLFVRVARGTALTQCPSCDRILFQRL